MSAEDMLADAWCPPSWVGEVAGPVRLRMSDQHADAFMRNEVAVVAEQDLRPVARKVAAWVPVPRAALEDAGAVWSIFEAGLDRHFRPWRYPDRQRWPDVVLLPRLAQTQAWVTATRARLAAAWRVLRYGEEQP